MDTASKKRDPHRLGASALGLMVAAMCLLGGLAPTSTASAGQLIYTPVNPSFGGNPLNGSYLLQRAQAGKKFKMPLDDFNFTGIVAQTDTDIIFQKDGAYFAYNINTGRLRQIDFDGAQLGTGDLAGPGNDPSP